MILQFLKDRDSHEITSNVETAISCRSFCLFVCLFVCLFICLFVCLFVCLLVCWFVSFVDFELKHSGAFFFLGGGEQCKGWLVVFAPNFRHKNRCPKNLWVLWGGHGTCEESGCVCGEEWTGAMGSDNLHRPVKFHHRDRVFTSFFGGPLKWWVNSKGNSPLFQ